MVSTNNKTFSVNEPHWECREIHSPWVCEGPLLSRQRKIVHKTWRRGPKVCDRVRVPRRFSVHFSDFLSGTLELVYRQAMSISCLCLSNRPIILQLAALAVLDLAFLSVGN